MATIKNIFAQGIMDKDTDRSLLKTYRHAENLRFHINDGNDGIGNNIKGTLEVSNATNNDANYKCVGAIYNEDNDRIYYLLSHPVSKLQKIIEYNITNNTTTTVLEGELMFHNKGYCTGINEIDGKLYWSLFGNNPRRINIERAKTWGAGNFDEEDITVAQYPPLQKLRLTLIASPDIEKQENHIEEKFLSFSYRYRYLDDEYSVLAPFTEFAFEPKTFDYNFAEQSNRSMINKFDKVKIEYNTGTKRVKEIQLVVHESNSNQVWIIDDFNKEKLGFGNNDIKEFEFDNQKIKRALPEHIVRSFFDNVPKTAKAQDVIGGRLMYGNYKENYDLIDENGNEIELDYKLNLLSEENGTRDPLLNIYTPSNIPKRTIRSNRDLEVMIAYGFEYGRMSTLLPSKTNTIYIPVEKSISENKIQVELNNNPPKEAKWFRFFIRESRKDYDTILPTIFYEDGVYRWIKLDGKDIDKVDKGDYLVIKSDSRRVQTALHKTKILEKEHKDKDFLGNDELSGTYIKILPDSFNFDLRDMYEYELNAYHTSWSGYHTPIYYPMPPATVPYTNRAYISKAHFYGTGLNDATSSGTPSISSNDNVRIRIKISTAGATDKFKWIDDNTNTWSSEIDIDGTEQDIHAGLKIKFDATTGHTLDDEWTVNVNGEIENWDSRSYGFYRIHGGYDATLTSNNETDESEKIYAGARIILEYDEYEAGDIYWKVDRIASRDYDNLEEFYYEENIGDAIIAQSAGFDLSHIYFIKGVLFKDDNATKIRRDDDGYTTMVIRSISAETATHVVRTKSKTYILQRADSNFIILETEGKETPKDIFYEIGKTYLIANNLHTKNSMFETEIPLDPTDQDQAVGVPLKVTLDWFNAYCWGNAVESYKIKDEFNAISLDDGVRVLTDIEGEYKEVHRIADLTWSDVYNKEMHFNGLSSFNLSLMNFVTLDREQGSIQKLFNDNGNLLVLQQGAVGLMPYNKNIIYDTTGGKMIGISTNILDAKSYRPYASGVHGISSNPESFVANGSRKYFTDALRGDMLRIANDGVFELNKYHIEHEFSNLMNDNKGQYLITGYDPKHKELLLYLPNTKKTLIFQENAKGYPQMITFEPDFMLGANNDLYVWKNGVMYRFNATEQRNTFFGATYPSKLNFFVNEGFDTEKIYKAIGLESTHAWELKLDTRLTSREIPINSFKKKEDYFYSEIMGNTNNNALSNSRYGLGTYAIVNGKIALQIPNYTISVGDYIVNQAGTINEQVTSVTETEITLANPINTTAVFLMYQKNANIDGESIRGDILEVAMEITTTDKVEIRAVRTEVIQSNLP